MVLAFGTFDPLHAGHRQFFREARRLGDALTVVVARDQEIRMQKHREPFLEEHVRLSVVASDASVDQAMLGDHEIGSYTILKTFSFDTLVLGYDQQPDDSRVREILHMCNKGHVSLVRLRAYMPERYKSSFFRNA